MRWFGSHKYSAKACEFDGYKFPSIAQATRYKELKLESLAGTISDLQLEINFPIIVNGTQVCIYRADFVYMRDGKQVIEDVKGMQTPVFRLKKKLFKAVYGKEILIT